MHSLNQGYSHGVHQGISITVPPTLFLRLAHSTAIGSSLISLLTPSAAQVSGRPCFIVHLNIASVEGMRTVGGASSFCICPIGTLKPEKF